MSQARNQVGATELQSWSVSINGHGTDPHRPAFLPGNGLREDVMLSKKLSALVALSMITASSAAVAQSAQPLSLGNAPAARSGAATADASALDDRNGIGIYIIGAVVLGLIIWGVIELTGDDDSDSP
jgi:hypothetical protein